MSTMAIARINKGSLKERLLLLETRRLSESTNQINWIKCNTVCVGHTETCSWNDYTTKHSRNVCIFVEHYNSLKKWLWNVKKWVFRVFWELFESRMRTHGFKKARQSKNWSMLSFRWIQTIFHSVNFCLPKWVTQMFIHLLFGLERWKSSEKKDDGLGHFNGASSP